MLRVEPELEAALGRPRVVQATSHVDPVTATAGGTHSLPIDLHDDLGRILGIEDPPGDTVTVQFVDRKAQHWEECTSRTGPEGALTRDPVLSHSPHAKAI